MPDELESYLSELTNQVLTAPGYRELPEEEKNSIRQRLSEHFQNLIMDTTLNRLTEEQVGELEELMKNDPEKAEKRMTELSAGVPGLAVDIEERLKREVEQLKKLAQEPEGSGGE